jgi:hypothetical protein
MNTEGDAADGRALLQQKAHCIAAVGGVVLFANALDRIVGARTVDPFEAVHPQTKLELYAVEAKRK